ncbi:MAG: hypothetical protein J7641_01430 [Cyanobacteria bacterium SID2]|nr:hypothetical protein [Cyanobacteria bacterium SID2]MBP0005772.1 hypothetical protein [Cyanobacteria bacterium SBC]
MKYSTLGLCVLFATLTTANSATAQLNRPNFFERGYDQFEEEIRQLERQPNNPSPLTVSGEEMTWYQVVLREGGFSIWMPEGTVVQEIEVVETSAGSIEFSMFATQPRFSRYVVAYSEPFDFSALGTSEEVLAKVRDRLIDREANFELTSDRDTTVGNFSAKDLIFNNDEETITFRLIFAEDRLYVLAVSQLNDAASLEAVAAFFRSFQKL